MLDDSIDIVFDINVYIDAFNGIKASEDCLEVMKKADGAYSLNLSRHIIKNVREKLTRTNSVLEVDKYIKTIILLQEGTYGSFLESVPHKTYDTETSGDHEDTLILDLALDTKSKIVTTSDKELLKLHPWRSHTLVLSPRKFVKMSNNRLDLK